MYKCFPVYPAMPGRRKNRRRVRIAAALLMVLFLFGFCEKKISPIAGQLAMNAAKETVGKRVSAVIAACVPQSPFADAENGNAFTGVTVDAMAISLWKAALGTQLTEELQKPITAKIPFGSLLPVKLLSGRGPGIRLRVPVQNVVHLSVRSEFLQAGINQTLHKITLQVQTSLCPYGNWMPEEETLTVEFPLSECILLGQVPERVGYY